MLCKNVFEKEVGAIKTRIRLLEEQSDDDATDARLAQEEIWELEEVLKYFKKRIADLA